MNRFWDNIMEPILECLQPADIVEIGCERGHNTRKILEYCMRHGATLYAIDPLPDFDTNAWQEQYGERFVFFKSLSLNAISKINRFDVVLIDGDHNWYTVYNELKLIEKQCLESGQYFPLIILHDISWPYGRRDQYCAPENIPEAYRKPYEKKGIRPGSPELQEKGGLNSHLFNSIYENKLRNGVLTAIEDFLSESKEAIDFIKIPGLNGLGIIYPCRLKEKNTKFKDLLASLTLSPAMLRHVEKIEEYRNKVVIARAENNSILQVKETQIEDLKQRLADIEKILSEKEDSFVKKNIEVAKLKQQLVDINQVKEIEIAEFEKRLAEKDINISFLNKELNQRTQLIEQLNTWANNLEIAISALLNTNRWNIGNSIVNFISKILLRSVTEPAILSNIQQILKNIKQGSNKSLNSGSRPCEKRKSISFTYSQLVIAPPIKESLTVDIIVCVHNAQDDVRACLESIINNTKRKFTLYIVNDGSDETTTKYLRQISSNQESIVLLENKVAQGYTRAANQGLRASTADYVILLNSDTIVPPQWLEKLLECGESDPRIGIIGPLSNAASWQSIPEIFDENGDFAINVLPDDFTVENMADIVGLASKKHFPRVPFINGFCFAIKRNVIETIGYLDEDTFPYGYGEENDYCLRASSKGIQLVVADHLYVFHAKSKSFGHKQRLELSRKGNDALAKKHGLEHINKLIAQIKDDLILNGIRDRIGEHIQITLDKAKLTLSDLRILYLLPIGGTGGGIHSIVQEVTGMRRLGIHVQIAVRKQNVSEYYLNYNSISECHEIFVPYDTVASLIDVAGSFNVVIATVFNSCEILKRIVDCHLHILPAYYVQDYEPLFFDENSREWQEAFKSYTLVPNCVLFAKTNWLAQLVKDKHGVPVYKVCPSLDQDIYYPKQHTCSPTNVIRVVAMIRPNTPRRGAGRTMRILKRLSQEFGGLIKIEIFGCTNDDKDFIMLDRDFIFSNHGILVREEVAELLRQAEIFLDLSDYQAFGRTGLEAMACNCAVVLPVTGGANDYAANLQNALLIDTLDEDTIYTAVRELVTSNTLRDTLRRNGLATAANYSIHRAAISILSVLAAQVKKRLIQGVTISNQNSMISNTDVKSWPRPLRVAALVARRGDGKPAGSGTIRIILPLNHPSVQEKLTLEMCFQDELITKNADIILVQRNMIPNMEVAQRLIERCHRESIKLVFEIDDDLFDTIGYRLRVGHEPPPGMLNTLILLASKADAVITSSPPLQQTLRQYNSQVYCLPNALDEAVWALDQAPPGFSRISTAKGDKIRILYMGTFTHRYDLALVETAAKRILSEYSGKVEFEFVGGLPGGLQLFGKQVLSCGKQASDDYPGFIKWLRENCNWDFGIIPLDIDDFNRKKSYIKFLDYSALGLASICTDIEPYRAVVKHEINGLLIPNTTEAWYTAIKRLIDDPPFRYMLADNARRDLLESNTLAVRANDYLHVYQEIANL